MRSGPGIGRILDVSFSLDWSWGLALPLVAWELATAIFPEWYPQWDSGTVWVTALAASLALFVSVLAHDLAHVIAARANRIPVRHITLFLFGGISDLPPESTSPGGEFGMAIAGPAASLVLGGALVFLGLVWTARFNEFMTTSAATLAGLDPVTALFLFSGAVNILLGALNMIPGFPLDGGRVLRSAMWAATGDLRWATDWACRFGQLLGCGLVAAGLVALGARPAISGAGWLAGLWVGLNGWLVNNAATASHRLIKVEDLVRSVPALQPLGARVPTVPPNIPLSNLVDDYLAGTGDHTLPVIENEHLVGLVCSQDVSRVPREQWDTTEVGEIMTSVSRVAVVRPARTGIDATRDQIQLPVNQQAVGVECAPGQEKD